MNFGFFRSNTAINPDLRSQRGSFILYLAILLLFYLPSSLSASIEIVYHIATLNSWEEVVCEQLATLERSGLGAACDRMTVTIVGPHIEKAGELFRRFPFYPKMRLVHASEDARVSEFPGIEMVKKIAMEREDDAKILYMHSKGITHLENDRTRNVRSWRRYLEYFLIERWEECIEALKTFNLCGVEWLNCTKSMVPQMENPGIFAGNFWWGRADYLRTCKDVPPRPWDPPTLYRERYDCEVFIASGKNPLPKTFHQSGANLYEFNYTEDYYKEVQLPKEEPIEIVYLAIAASERLPCLKEHLQLLQETSLAASSDRISFVVLGPELKKVEELVLPISDKARLIYASSRLSPGEFPAFELIKRIARANPGAKICYLHNFGGKYPKAPPPKYKSIGHAVHQTFIRKRKEIAVWLKNLFSPAKKESSANQVIREWSRCLNALQSANLSGHAWKSGIPRRAHFPDIVCSGYFEDNCWWARADYLNTCQDVHFRSPYHVYREHWTPSWCKENCVDCRMFVGTGDNPQVFDLIRDSSENGRFRVMQGSGI